MNRINIPNLLSGLRILLIPVLIIVFYTAPLDWRYLASAIVFFVAAITDWLDGYLARSMGQMTPFGAFLDPVADKLLVATSLVLLVEVHASAILAVPAIVIVGREIVVSALREWMAELGKRGVVAVSIWGKVKTAAQMLSIIALLSRYNEVVIQIGYGLLYIATALTISSMISYLWAAGQAIKEDNK